MTTYRDQALVLRKLDYGEADRIYTLLTREHGKVGAIAKGVRRTSSRLAAALELYGRVDVLLARGRNLDVIAQAQRVAGARMAADVARTAHAALVAELAERVTDERHPMDGLYELAAGSLSEMAIEDDPRRASAWFLARALDLLGVAPQLDMCVVCGRPLPPAPAAFLGTAGGLVGLECGAELPFRVSVPAIKVLRVMAVDDVALYRRLKLDDSLLLEVEDVLLDQLEHHLDRRLKSAQFLRQLRSFN
jgi:DNA repair protein RecO (recombination protein O)